MSTETKHKPGQKAKASGQYMILNPNGKPSGKERTVVKGEKFPPTPGKKMAYVLVDRTKTN